MMDRKLLEKLRAMTGVKVLFDEPLDRYTSLRVGGPADALVFPETEEALGSLVALIKEARCPFLTVGNWTNLIVRDGGYRGVVVSMAALHGLTLQKGNDDFVTVDAMAGTSMAELVRFSAEKAFSGMAFCAGIPGSVGGAVAMNAGAYGREIKDVIEQVRLMDSGGIVSRRLRQALSFSYRKMDLPEGMIVLSASFRFERGDRTAIQKAIMDIMEKRREKHPLQYPSAGSIFKNPAEGPAGRLIEEAGLKGMQIGGARISDQHGNFIINTGSARAADILELMTRIRKAVLLKRGIALEPEVRIVGEQT